MKKLPKTPTWNELIGRLPSDPSHDQQTGQFISQPDSQLNDLQSSPQANHATSADAYDDRRVPRDRNAVSPARLQIVKRNEHGNNAAQAALALLFQLTLDQAVAILKALPDTKPTLVNLEIEQRAFLRLRSHLEQQNYAQQPAHCLPLLTLLVRCIGHLNDPAQRELAMKMVTQSLRILPQIEIIETLAAELASLSPTLQQCALDHIEEFLWRTADIAQAHVDILLELTRAVRIDACRERAGALIAAGLKRLHNDPVSCGQIRRNLILAYCTTDKNLQLQA